MNPVITQPGMITTQTVTIQHGPKWGSNLCDCCEDCGIFCCALWCFPCLQCRTASEFGECYCLPLMDPLCMGYVGCSGVCPPMTIAMRTGVRERYHIQGSVCDDCITSCCCYSCTWCQMAREIKFRSNGTTVTTAQTTIIDNMIPQAHGYTPLVQY